MKKRNWLVAALGCALALVLTCGLTGCGDEGEAGGAGGSDAPKKVAMFLDGPVNDGGWGASCYGAMCDAAKEHGWETAYTESVTNADWVSTIQSYVDQDYDLIIAPGNQYIDVMVQCAKDNPDAHFCIFNAEVNDVPNIECTMPDTIQIGQIAGIMAGLMSETNNIGFIGGVELDTTQNKLKGYTEAAQKINPDIKVASAYAGSFSDSPKGKELATSMINNNNVDVMFGDASIVDTGAREALEAAGEGHFDIGQPGDIGGKDDKLIVTSVVTDNVKMTSQVMTDLENNDFGGKTVMGSLKNGCVYAGTMSDIVPEETQKQFNDYIEQLKNGEF